MSTEQRCAHGLWDNTLCDVCHPEIANPAEGRVVHCKRERHDVYIGRPSIFGNPFTIGKDGDRETVIAKYREYAIDLMSKSSIFRNKVLNLRGKVLGCWCAPNACHGDVLLELARTG